MEASNEGISQGSVETNPDEATKDISIPIHQDMKHEKLFRDVGKQVDRLTGNNETGTDQDAEDAPNLVEEIESLCMNCEKNVRYSLRLDRSP